MSRGARMLDLQHAFEGAGGASLAVLFAWLLGRTETVKDRREREFRRLAIEAVRESSEYTTAQTQKIVNEQLSRDIAAVKDTVVRLDDKFDTLNDRLLNGRISIRRD